MTFNKKDALDKFDDFLFMMDDQLEWLQQEADKHSIDLDLKTNSLGNLEKLFDLLSEDEDDDTIDGLIVVFARYLGEIVRLNYGGQWELSLSGSKVNFNKPIIAGHSYISGLEFSPILVMRAYAVHRKEGTLRRAIENHVNFKPLDLSHLPTEK